MTIPKPLCYPLDKINEGQERFGISVINITLRVHFFSLMITRGRRLLIWFLQM